MRKMSVSVCTLVWVCTHVQWGARGAVRFQALLRWYLWSGRDNNLSVTVSEHACVSEPR